MDWQENDPPPPPRPQDRFAEGIELDDAGPEDPVQALWDALARNNAERAIGAFRLIEASGRRPDLEPALALELADLLERHELFLDAARACRLAAETDLQGLDAPAAIFRGARLLLGPAHHREAGLAMLRFLIERYPEHRLAPEARSLIERIERGEPTGLEQAPRDGVVEHLRPARQVAADQANGPAPVGCPLAQAIQRVTGHPRSARYRTLARAVRLALLLFAGLWAMTWFLRDRHQSVERIHPAVIEEPIQTPAAQPAIIEFSRDGYHYQVTPKYDYSLAALIVSLKDYTHMSVRQSDTVFPMDLCVIWGDNVRRRVHQSKEVEFEQHGRFCSYRYSGQARVKNSSLSNNHLLLADTHLQAALDGLATGDQVRLRGQLVDVKAHLTGAGGNYDPKSFKMISSTQRSDAGGGACEVIFLREIEVLERANPVARALSVLSFWALVGLIGLVLLRLALLPIRLREIG